MTSSDNKNFGDVERAAVEGTEPSSVNCCAGGLVGLFRISTEERLAASFNADMTFADVKSLGRAGMLFGMVRSDSFADLKFPNCVVGGHLKSPVGGHDLDMTADNLTSNADLAENSYLWGYFPKGHVGLEINGLKFGNASDYDK